MTEAQRLLQKIEKKTATIGIIGLGYVGLPLALLFAKKGFSVLGFTRNKAKADLLKKGKNQLADRVIDREFKGLIKKKRFTIIPLNRKDLERCDVLIICVPTPVDKDKKPDLSDLQNVGKTLGHIRLLGKLIINESTVAPFTTRDILGTFKSDYFLVASPERIDPGNKTKTTETIPKVVGGSNRESTRLAKTLYKMVINADIVEVASLEAAEMAKMLENTYRAVNIALIDEFAKLAEICGIDILDVINAAKTKWTFQAHYPGIGVGGHCIPVDPYYILSLARDRGSDMAVVAAGLSEINEMPRFVAEKVFRLYKKGMRVLVYGITYKKDVPDLRESPVVVFCRMLADYGINFTLYDPFVSPAVLEKIGMMPGKLAIADIFIVGTDHSVLTKDYTKAIGKNTIVIDGRNFFPTKVGRAVYGVGRTMV